MGKGPQIGDLKFLIGSYNDFGLVHSSVRTSGGYSWIDTYSRWLWSLEIWQPQTSYVHHLQSYNSFKSIPQLLQSFHDTINSMQAIFQIAEYVIRAKKVRMLPSVRGHKSFIVRSSFWQDRNIIFYKLLQTKCDQIERHLLLPVLKVYARKLFELFYHSHYRCKHCAVWRGNNCATINSF